MKASALNSCFELCLALQSSPAIILQNVVYHELNYVWLTLI